MSLRSRAARSSGWLRRDCATGATSVQCRPTGQRWKRHQPNRSAFTDAPGNQIVVNRWPSRQRTTVYAPIWYPRRLATIVPITFTATAATSVSPRWLLPAVLPSGS